MTLELEITILKAQRATDQGKISDLKRDISLTQASCHSIQAHIKRLSEELERVQAQSEAMKQNFHVDYLQDQWHTNFDTGRLTLASELDATGESPKDAAICVLTEEHIRVMCKIGVPGRL